MRRAAGVKYVVQMMRLLWVRIVSKKEVKVKDENLEKNIEEMNQRIIETDEQLKSKSNEVENLNNKVKELKFKLSLAEIKNNGINGRRAGVEPDPDPKQNHKCKKF